MATILDADLDKINKRTYVERQAVRVYGRAQGWVDEGERRAVERVSDKLRERRILDIGIGGGRTTGLLQPISTDYVGIDYAPTQIDTARHHHPGVDLRVMDARELDFPNHSFDLVVFSFNGIDSVDIGGRLQILSEVHRVLQPGGSFLFSSLSLDGPSFREKFSIPINFNKGFGRFARESAVFARWAAFSSIIGLRTYLRVRRRRHNLPSGFKLKQISPHYYGLVVVFSSMPAQVGQLRDAGFEVLKVFDEQGAQLDFACSVADSRWCYYCARKPAAALPE